MLCYVGIGSNLGNRKKNIQKAIKLLKQKGIKIKKISSIIETIPEGNRIQPNYLNGVLEIETDLSPLKLLRLLKSIEKEMGRKKTFRFGPRIIDLDILLYEDLKINTRQLTIPHPRMWQRDFVMKPLREIAPHIFGYEDN